MKYTEYHKQQYRDFIKEGMLRAGSYFYQTHGLPLDMFVELASRMETLGEQMVFLNNLFIKNPKPFHGMPNFKLV